MANHLKRSTEKRLFEKRNEVTPPGFEPGAQIKTIKKFDNSYVETSSTLVISEFANVSPMSENHRVFAKITKIAKSIKNGQTSSF